MLQRFTLVLSAAMHAAVQKINAYSTLSFIFIRDTGHILRSTAHHILLISGAAAISIALSIWIKPELARQVRTQYLTSQLTEDAAALPALDQGIAEAGQLETKSGALVETADAVHGAEPIVSSGGNVSVQSQTGKQQQWVAYWIAKRYHIASDAAGMFVKTSYSTAQEIKLDPLLILAVIAIESRFNPYAESSIGAQGLMQVMSKIHRQKFEEWGGLHAALNPAANIRVGSAILKDYVKRGGSVAAGLKFYVGAGDSESDDGYGEKVLEEYRRLKDVAAGKRISAFTTTASSAAPKLVIENTHGQTLPIKTQSEPSKPVAVPVVKSDQIALL